MSRPKPPHHELEFDRDFAFFAIEEFNAVIKYLVSRGQQGFADYLVNVCEFSNHFAKPVHRERFDHD